MRLRNINRSRANEHEVFRTPANTFEAILDHCPELFQGVGFDPSAGDGRMLAEIVRRGNVECQHANEIRPEERPALELALPSAVITIEDYLSMKRPPFADFLITNPPFTLSRKFVDKAHKHIAGPICILQSLAWLGSGERSRWWPSSGLESVYILSKRPKWELDIGAGTNNHYDYAWYVFQPGHRVPPAIEWI